MRRPWIPRHLLLSFALGMGACVADPPVDIIVGDAHPAGRGSGAMATSRDADALYVAVTDDDTIARVDTSTLDVRAIALPGEPTRLARVGDRLFVTLRARRAIAELVDDDGTLRLLRQVEVGAEPFGIVSNAIGDRLYVAISQAHEVLELDSATLEVLRTWPVAGEPRWLALHSSTLYVAGLAPDRYAWIDLASGEASEAHLPTKRVVREFGGAGVRLTGRITGDLGVSATHVAMPALYLDNRTIIPETDPEDPLGIIGDGGYHDGTRMISTIVLVPTDTAGRPVVGDTEVIHVAFFCQRLDAPTSASFSPDGQHILATIGGNAQVVTMPLTSADSDLILASDPDAFAMRPVGSLVTAAGPQSVVMTSPQNVYVYGFLDRRITSIEIDDLGRIELAAEAPPMNDYYAGTSDALAAPSRPPGIEAGRRLFFSANDPSVSSGSVSCSSCHIDGRTDGLTWMFERGPRQTPSLAGMVSLREPVGWQGDRPTVAFDAAQTSLDLMGGSGMTDEEAANIAAFIDDTRAVDLPLHGVSNEQIERGRAIFGSEEAGCADCHSGAIYSDNRTYDMNGMIGVKTPSLLGVAATPPYLHDGSAPDLTSVLDHAQGDRWSLDDEAMADLVMFLRTL